MSNFTYEVIQHVRGWHLRFLEAGEEVGGGVFPIDDDPVDGLAWWNSLSAREREYWQIAADSEVPAKVWTAYQLMQALEDAFCEGERWLESR